LNWKLIVGLVLCTGLIGQDVFAADAAEPYRWLSQAQEQALTDSVPPPPATNSAEDAADLAKVLLAQTTRTPAEVAEAELDKHLTDLLFQPVYGSNLTPQNSPKFYLLMKHVLEATRVVDDSAKNKYQRPRPYQGHPDVVKSLFTTNGYSYPSGHAMASYSLAVVLGAVFPGKQQAFLDRAQLIAKSRVNAGVHYSSDIKEGEALGRAVGAAILASDSFQKDLTEVRAELKM
jgi:acid phosphatase (class A)